MAARVPSYVLQGGSSRVADRAVGDGRRLLVMVDLGDGIPVEAEVVGTSWDVSPLGSARLVLPAMPEAWDADLLAPAIESADAALAWFTQRDTDEGAPWGSGSAAQHGRMIEAYLNRALVVLRAPSYETQNDGRAMLDEMARTLDEWVGYLIEWLEVIATVDLHPRGQSGRLPPRHVHPLTIAVDDVGAFAHYPAMSQIGAMYRPPLHVSVEHWGAAISRTNTQTRPPEDHLLLRDSRTAAARDDYRKAVIDATTAAEVALAQAIRTRLDRAPDNDAVERVMRTASGSAGLYDLAVALGVEVGVGRGRLIDQLAAVRNSAVHRGVEPTLSEMRDALTTASAIVSTVSPIVT